MTTPIVPTEDNNQEPTEVKGHILSSDQLNGWGNEDIMTEPRLIDENGQTRRESGNEEESPTKDDAVVDDEEQEDLPDPEPYVPPVAIDDPGEFVPNNSSFEVTIYSGEEGKEKPKTIKVTSVEQAEELLEQDPNFGSAKNLLDFNRKVTRMESNLEREAAANQALVDAYEEQAGSEQERQDRVNTIANELVYLEGKGKLPQVPAKLRSADWNDKEVAKDPAVKAQLELLKYMAKENTERQKLGISPMGAVDAFNQMQNEANEKKTVDNKQEAANARKQAGARVAGTSPGPVSNVPKGISVGRGGNLRDLNSNNWGF